MKVLLSFLFLAFTIMGWTQNLDEIKDRLDFNMKLINLFDLPDNINATMESKFNDVISSKIK